MTHITLKDRRYTIAPAGRPTARVYHLPRRATEALARPTPLRLVWSLDRATGTPVSRWVRADEEAEPTSRRTVRGWLRTVSAAFCLAA
jgi:hypothetical protein